MDEKDPQLEERPAEPVKYATPMQRLWAWVGVVYMVLLVLLSTYALSHGAYLRGIGGIMTAPALAGLGGAVILRHRQGLGRGGLPVCVFLSSAFFLLAAWNVIRSVPALLQQL